MRVEKPPGLEGLRGWRKEPGSYSGHWDHWREEPDLWARPLGPLDVEEEAEAAELVGWALRVPRPLPPFSPQDGTPTHTSALPRSWPGLISCSVIRVPGTWSLPTLWGGGMPPWSWCPALAGSLPCLCRGGRRTGGLVPGLSRLPPSSPRGRKWGGGVASDPGPAQPREISRFRVPATAQEAGASGTDRPEPLSPVLFLLPPPPRGQSQQDPREPPGGTEGLSQELGSAHTSPWACLGQL